MQFLSCSIVYWGRMQQIEKGKCKKLIFAQFRFCDQYSILRHVMVYKSFAQMQANKEKSEKSKEPEAVHLNDGAFSRLEVTDAPRFCWYMR